MTNLPSNHVDTISSKVTLAYNPNYSSICTITHPNPVTDSLNTAILFTVSQQTAPERGSRAKREQVRDLRVQARGWAWHVNNA